MNFPLKSMILKGAVKTAIVKIDFHIADILTIIDFICSIEL